MSELYRLPDCCGGGALADGDAVAGLDADAVDRILRRIASKSFDAAGEIEPELFFHTFDTLTGAVDKVFGAATYGTPDFEFANEIRRNIGVFAAAKTHRQQNDLYTQMWDENGRVRSFGEFRKASLPIVGQYNVNWLQTEYDTCIIRAQNAQKWREMERNADLYPNGQWLPSTSVHPREEHKAFYHKVWPLSSTFWSTNHPGSLWGCKCGFRSTSEPATDARETKRAVKATPPAAPGLGGNPGKTAAVFDVKSHPYAKLAYTDYKKLRPMVERYADRVMLRYAEAKAKEVKRLIDPFRGLVIPAPNLHTGRVMFLRRCFKDIRTHNPDYRVLMHVTNPERAVLEWKYIGSKPVAAYPKGHPKAGLPKHTDTEYFTYYRVQIGGKTNYVHVRFDKKTQAEIPYAITDELDMKGMRK